MSRCILVNVLIVVLSGGISVGDQLLNVEGTSLLGVSAEVAQQELSKAMARRSVSEYMKYAAGFCMCVVPYCSLHPSRSHLTLPHFTLTHPTPPDPVLLQPPCLALPCPAPAPLLPRSCSESLIRLIYAVELKDNR